MMITAFCFYKLIEYQGENHAVSLKLSLCCGVFGAFLRFDELANLVRSDVELD